MPPLTGHFSHIRPGILRVIGVIGLVAIALTIAPGLGRGAPSTAAEPPPAQTGSAVIGLFVGGDRVSETEIGGLGGATFGFFTTRPTSYDPQTGFATDTPEYTCTSTADGWCNLTVPIGAAGVAAGTRLWVAPLSGPTGWYDAPYWQTAPLTGGQRVQTQHVLQTPALQSGGRYVSTDPTNQFMSDPGAATSDTAFNNANGGTTGSGTTGSNVQRRTASSGVWPLLRANPALPAQCGLRVALVVDLSSSVVGHVPALKNAMDQFVNALQGTPSQLALITFGTGSPANGFPNSNTGLMPVATTADTNRIKALYAGWGNPPTNYTNWDAGLNQVAAINDSSDPNDHIDLTVVLTDGNPTVYGQIPGSGTNNPTVPTGSGFTRFREMENSTASANRVKSQGSRVIAVGVGDGLDEGAGRNLRSISGPVKYDGSNIDTADYLQEASYADAGAALRNLVVSQCAPSISVIKQIIPAGGTTADAYTPAVPWQFTASTTTPGASVTPPATRSTDTYTGGTNFDVDVPNDGSPGTFGIDETPQTGYTLTQVDGDNAVCVDKTHDDDPVPVTNTGPHGFSVDLVSDSAVSCVVYNRAPDASQASVVVHKRWRVTTAAGTTTYDNGRQPEDLEAFLRLGGPTAAEPSDQAWDVPRDGYTPGQSVGVAEDVNLIPPGCTLTGATMTGTGITGERDLGTTAPATTVDDIPAGVNEWTITNSVDCHSQLTLVKQVEHGDASPSDWTLHAYGEDPALPGPSGTTGVSREVTPNSPYQLAEDAGSDPELLNYIQPDLRPRPIAWPRSTGSVDCVETDGNQTQPGDPLGRDGSVSVPLGQHYTCTFTNVTASLNVIKDVDGGTADPSDFHFSLVPVAPHPDGLPSRHFAGAASPGHHTIVRPGQTYRLTEVGGPEGYQLVRLDCSGVTMSADQELTIPAGGSGVCTAHNSYSTWTAEKTSDPPPGQVSPGTVITYTLTARHLDGNPTHDVLISDDLSGVLSHATLVAGSIDASAGTAHREGDQIIWTIPVLDGVETVRFQVKVDPQAYGVTLLNRLGEHTTGDPEDPATPGDPDRPGDTHDGDQAIPCQDLGDGKTCDQTTHVTPPRTVASPPAGGATLPDTGGPSPWWLWGGLLLVCVGGTMVVAARTRPKRG